MTIGLPDEFRPNAPPPELRRQLRIEVERPTATIVLSVDDPEPAEVAAFIEFGKAVVER